MPSNSISRWLQIRDELLTLKERKNESLVMRGKCESRLKDIANEIRGKRLPQGNYNQLCHEQGELTKKVARYAQESREWDLQIQRLADEEEAMDKQTRADKNDLLSAILAELKKLNAQVAERGLAPVE
jgi:hypothetical protein